MTLRTPAWMTPIWIGLAALAALCALALLRGKDGPGSPAFLRERVRLDAERALAGDPDTAWAKVSVRETVAQVYGAPPDPDAAGDVNRRLERTLARYKGFPGVFLELRPTQSAPTAPAAAAPAAPAAPTSIAGALRPGAPAPVVQCQQLYDAALGAGEILFRFDSHVIQPRSYAQLNQLAAVARQCGAFKVRVGGHTDNRGDPAHNRILSEQRAQAVIDYLVRQGAPAQRFSAVGYGADKPVTAARGAAADARNRRITFEVSES
ncbi:MAG: OmpA family protein [Hyphomonadaceae bacterium]